MTETADILCAPPVLEPGWAQFIQSRVLEDDGSLRTMKAGPVVIWVSLEAVPNHRPCKCTHVHVMHESTVDWGFRLPRRTSTKTRVFGAQYVVCPCVGRFIE